MSGRAVFSVADPPNSLQILRDATLGSKKDLPLSSVNYSFLEDWLIVWGNRPTSKKGKPVSVEWATGVISTIRDFVRFLHRSEFDWRKPSDYEVLPVRVRADEQDHEKEERVKTYKADELKTLWEYATPRERVYIALGLNCGFGMGEVATLRTPMIELDKRLIKGRRRKTGVFCKWRLWPETVAAIKWYQAKARPKTDSAYLFITDSGKPLNERTKGGNRKQDIPNAWDRLLKRIRKDHPAFPSLTYNKLRKTGANWLRGKLGGELADVYLAHGTKKVVDNYSNKPFKAMFRGLKKLRVALSEMFETVEDPFPEVVSKGNRSLSLNTIKKIQQMRTAGYKMKAVAQECKVGIDTVRRYQIKRSKKEEGGEQ